MTKELALRYVRAWGEEKTAENIAFYWEALELLIRTHYPELVAAGYGAAGAANILLRRAAHAKGQPPAPACPVFGNRTVAAWQASPCGHARTYVIDGRCQHPIFRNNPISWGVKNLISKGVCGYPVGPAPAAPENPVETSNPKPHTTNPTTDSLPTWQPSRPLLAGELVLIPGNTPHGMWLWLKLLATVLAALLLGVLAYRLLAR